MREILFRGKRADNEEWVYGYYLFVEQQDKHYILTGKLASYSVDCSHSNLKTNGFEWFEVDPETVGQYTGLKDINGERIFENDIVKASYSIDNYSSLFKTMSVENFVNVNCLVIFDFAEFKLKNPNSLYCKSILGSYNEEVIGNIHDNKDLIGE